MHIMNIKQIIIGLVVLLSAAGLALASNPIALVTDQPDLPPACADLQVLAGNVVALRVYAIGVQIYRWNGAEWALFAPDASLFADANYRGKVGTHYGGPTWETNSGSYVIGRRVKDCTPDPTAIAWLLLEADSNKGPGVFGTVTYIQRVNTTGGLKPTMPGSSVGEEKKVSYTAEYYFYQAEN